MRNGRGCGFCRERHLKCILDRDETVCRRCQETNNESCDFEPKFRFKQIAHIDTVSQGIRFRTSLTHNSDQEWPESYQSLQFILEDGSGQDDSAIPLVQDQDVEDQTYTTRRTPLVDSRTIEPSHGFLSPDQVTTRPSAIHSVDQTVWRVPEIPDKTAYSPFGLLEFSSPASITELSRRYEIDGGRSIALNESVLPKKSVIPLSPAIQTTIYARLSRREAFLMQHYIQTIAPWIDACDLSQHFALEVPKRAMQYPMVQCAILALSARHQAILRGHDEHEASFYHGQCLRQVIEALSKSEATYDDNLIATVVLLRVYEEFEVPTDNYLHIHGMKRLLSAVPTFMHSGGLGEAACWQSLRQDIFVSLVKEQPPSYCLENYDHSLAFTFGDDGMCANVIVLLFAKILRLVYRPVETIDQETLDTAWTTLEEDVETWNERRLHLFQPMYEQDMDVESNRPFPVICVMNASQVVSMQHYYVCKVFLLLHKPSNHVNSRFQAVKRQRLIEKMVVKNLAAIIGLTLSNDLLDHPKFAAHHTLRTCGYLIEHPLQRNVVLRLLHHMRNKMGWDTSHTIRLLQTQWSDLDDANT